MDEQPLLWRILARTLATFPIRQALMRRALKTPYTHIGPTDNLYMERYWVFNPYRRDYRARIAWLPSMRLHIIHRPDDAAHMHDHPLRSRAIILKGWYAEGRYMKPSIVRSKGDTYSLRPGIDFHHIYATAASTPAITLFITWPIREPGVEGWWGFLVGGVKVDHVVYLKKYRDRAVSQSR